MPWEPPDAERHVKGLTVPNANARTTMAEMPDQTQTLIVLHPL
jgi:hypothetical protein